MQSVSWHSNVKSIGNTRFLSNSFTVVNNGPLLSLFVHSFIISQYFKSIKERICLFFLHNSSGTEFQLKSVEAKKRGFICSHNFSVWGEGVDIVGLSGSKKEDSISS